MLGSLDAWRTHQKPGSDRRSQQSSGWDVVKVVTDGLHKLDVRLIAGAGTAAEKIAAGKALTASLAAGYALGTVGNEW